MMPPPLRLAGLLLACTPSALPAQWALQATDSTTEYRGFAAVSATTAWASGRGGAWARTTDGGQTWATGRIPGADSLFLIDVHAPSAAEAVVLGTSFEGGLARAYRTTDGGATWAQAWEDRREGVFFDGMAFVDARRGVAFGDPMEGRLALALTNDGGQSWYIPPDAERPELLPGEAGFAASGTAITSRDGTVWIGTGGGAAARVLRSTDAGRTWTASGTGLPAGTSAGIFGVAFRDGRRGVAVGGDYQQPTQSAGNLALTSDGGRTWRVVSGSGLEGVQYGVVHAGGGSYVATNPRGSFVSHDDGLTWRRMDHGPWNTAGFASGAGWAAGPRGRLGRYVGPPPGRPEPSLVVLLVLDQFRNDYLDRHANQWRGGLARLLREGTFYLEGRQDHGLTATAPGHATLLSGRDPASTGIISNVLGVGGADWPLVSGRGGGASPARFRGTTLLDWLRKADRGTRALGVAAKDRSAILPLGRAAGQVYWWGGGQFTTSRWYADSLPTWLQAFNARPWQRALAGGTWELSRPTGEYPEPDSVPWEHGGRDVTFPHALPADSAALADQVIYYPWIDSLTLALALEGAQQLGLGTRDAGPDLLTVSLSGLDRVGHRYGPESREVHDHLLRLDGWLGTFLDSLEVLARGRPLLAVTADHGVQSIAEGLVASGQPGGRTSLRPLAAALRDSLQARWGGRPVDVRVTTGMIYGDVALLRARGMDVDSLSSALAAAAERLPGVARVHTPASLAEATDEAAERWRRQFPADFGWFIAADPEPGWVWYTGTGADHESSVLDDRRVPILFWGPGVPAVRCRAVVPVVDIGPTLAAWLGVIPTETLDGQPLPLDRCRP